MKKDLVKHQRTSFWAKRCEFCMQQRKLLHSLIYHLGEIMEEDEHHVLIYCPRDHEHRSSLESRSETKLLLQWNEEHLALFHWNHVKHFGRHIKKIFSNQYPHSKDCKRRIVPPRTLEHANIGWDSVMWRGGEALKEFLILGIQESRTSIDCIYTKKSSLGGSGVVVG